MIYLDSCAIVKLIAPETETPALVGWLDDHPGERVTSALSEIEVPRALRRAAPRRLGIMSGVLSRMARFEVDAPVRATAAAYMDSTLRSLDAIHLATAENLTASGMRISAFVTYDKRLGTAAAESGLTVVAPGAV
ncbi:MAG TPA: type II toxin-antitoxin system VapC family toxin [Actinophytocola sp.]|uniref:type II toxin-antitoxin system VapC family toxin n=1 Tax=Actinophytocola sp. TaxID=1872138 RepID=UPI002DBF07EB|nr:type II toxin-antitoxin system VapC family toxin [Actinophytocola sp.]HEU5469589.1 type II toxin-antitoxin system VapC family toxin [Actinophytocola sp.]